MNLEKLYRYRFSDQERQGLLLVWKALVKGYLSRWIRTEHAVLDYGAGTCYFINNVSAARRVALDINPDVQRNCAEGVEFVCGDSPEVLGEQKFDVIFVSNLLEHLDSAETVVALLEQLLYALADQGSLIILQPNFALVGGRYFDFIDHKTILTDRSLDEALALAGGRITFMKRRFLPYTSKSRLPKAAWLVRAYLRLPLAQFLLGKQTLVVATRAN
jgi:hypothetical protein